MAKIRRIADRAHRGQLFAGGGLFVDHLGHVAGLVDELGGGTIAVAAAWLYAVPATGTGLHDLLRQGIPARVVNAVDVLQQRPAEYPPQFTDRLLRHWQAALIRYAVLGDWHRHLAGAGRYEHWRSQHDRLADALGLPLPARKPGLPPGEVDRLIGQRPAGEEHWGPIARTLERLRDPRALPTVVEAYHEVNGDDARRCCLPAVRSAIFTIGTTPENAAAGPVMDLAERWWKSPDPWEEQVAVAARAAAGDPAQRAALIGKFAAHSPGVVTAAINGLVGRGDRAEVESLRRVVTTPEPNWRWARSAAARRLFQIGGPDAEAALDERCLSPVDPPWRDDPDWLRRNGTRVIPVLIGKLSDRRWQFEASYALGELRAAEAIGPLCDAAATVTFPVPHIEALGKIRSATAVPALLDHTRHTHHEVRDHALRALDRIGDPRAVDAAVTACDDPHPVVRDRAARLLARHGDTRAVPQLIRLCDGPHAAIAAAALTRIGDPRARPTLWRLFADAPDKKTRHAAGRGIARIDGTAQYLHSDDVRIRRAYLWLLGLKPQWNRGHYVTGALSDEDPISPARAIAALARLGDPANTEHIRPLLDDPDPRVRANPATAIGRLGGEHAREWLDAHPADPHRDVRSAVAAAHRRLDLSPTRPDETAGPQGSS
jgi:HEAT repeat protein